MNLRSIIRKLDIAEAIIRPANSFGARLKRLTPEQRAAFDRWRELRDRWAALFDEPDGMYRAIMDGNRGPQLSVSIAAVLFDQPPQILATDTDTQANEKWQKGIWNRNYFVKRYDL